MSRSSRRQRGFTVAELLSVIFLMALLMSAVALIIGPLMRSQSRTQAKVDTVQAADMALYRMQRDLRNTTLNQVYSCTTAASPICATPAPALTTTAAIVIASAYQNGSGPFQLTSGGAPKWQGATVYWVDAKGNIDVAFDVPSGYVSGNSLTLTDAQHAVSDVKTNGGMQLARFVETLSLAEPANSGHKLSLQMQAQSTVNGATNETTYLTDLEARN